jgi:DNA-directed RNA polymerase subunit H (RpoH/RPB5)
MKIRQQPDVRIDDSVDHDRVAEHELLPDEEVLVQQKILWELHEERSNQGKT